MDIAIMALGIIVGHTVFYPLINKMFGEKKKWYEGFMIGILSAVIYTSVMISIEKKRKAVQREQLMEAFRELQEKEGIEA